MPTSHHNITDLPTMQAEHSALADRVVGLASYIKSGVFKTLPAKEQHDLHTQYNSMESYAWVLQSRINRASANAKG